MNEAGKMFVYKSAESFCVGIFVRESQELVKCESVPGFFLIKGKDPRRTLLLSDSEWLFGSVCASVIEVLSGRSKNAEILHWRSVSITSRQSGLGLELENRSSLFM